MKTATLKRVKGMTLIEIMEALLVLAIAVLGASGYRYYSALDARKADMNATGSRIGMLLCESWRGAAGSETYDPVANLGSELTIAPLALSSQFSAADFTSLGGYMVVADGINYYAALGYKDVSPGLRALNVVVGWAQKDQGPSTPGDADKLFKLTTYTAN
jgi:prepilin-type N-terminal cleavage/methylation domain-containing protein